MKTLHICLILSSVIMSSCAALQDIAPQRNPDRYGWYRFPQKDQIRDTLLQNYLSWPDTGYQGGLFFQHHQLADVDHLDVFGQSNVRAGFLGHPGCEGLVSVGGNVLPCSHSGTAFEANYPSLFTPGNFADSLGTDFPVIATVANGDTLLETSLYIPAEWSVTDCPKPALSPETNHITWIADPNNANGVIVRVEYSPGIQSVYDPSIAGENPDFIRKFKRVPDSGELLLTAAELEEFPESSTLQITLARWSHAEVGNKYYLKANTFWHIELPKW